MNQPNPEFLPNPAREAVHLTEDEIICTALGDADFLLQARADAHAQNCLVCREMIRFFQEIACEPAPGDPVLTGRRWDRGPGDRAGRIGLSDLDFPSVSQRKIGRLRESRAWASEIFLGTWSAKPAEGGAEPAAAITFAALDADFRTLSTERECAHFFAALMDPHARPWFRACHALVHGDVAEECGAELLSALSVLPELQGRMARLHYEIARALRTAERSLEAAAPAFAELAQQFHEPPALVADIAQELLTAPELLQDIVAKAQPAGIWHGDLLPAEREERVGGVLIEEEGGSGTGRTIAVFLTLEIISRRPSDVRSLVLYPAPAIALWDRDADFRASEAAAAAYAEAALPEPCRAEVRWRLTRHLAGGLPGKLCGPSLGLAFGFLLRRLFARRDEPVARVNLSGVALAGAITRTGAIQPVGALLAKALHREIFHTLLAPRQQIVHPHFVPVPGHAGDPSCAVLTTRDGAVHVVRQADVESGAAELELDCQIRWQGFDFTLPARPVGFVGREELTGKILEFIRTTASGYGVVQGGAGTGKTSFMKALLHRLNDDRVRLAFHFVPAQPGAASRAENLARKIYFQLRRGHLSPEPAEWAEWAIARKLAELLKFLSGRNAASGTKDVILIDAADEVELPEGTALVPDFLPAELPPGIVCLISSRPDLDWLRDPSPPAAFFKMGNGRDGHETCTNDRADIRRYLDRWNFERSGKVTLPAELVAGMMTQPVAPVFFTVVKLLAELETPTLTATRRRDLLTKPELWVRPPEELIRREIRNIIRSVRTDEAQADAVWDILGVLAVAREPVCKEELRGLGLWQECLTDTILRAAASFFLPRCAEGPWHRDLFRFDHPGYPRMILELFGEDARGGREYFHRLIGEKCLGWNKLPAMARRYALRFAPAHLRRAGMWEELYELLTDFAYLEERMLGYRQVPGAADQSPGAQPELPQRMAARVLRDLERALFGQPVIPLDHRWRPALEALHRAVETHAAILHEAPELLVQQLCNDLIWDWDERTDLGRKLRHAASHAHRIVLRRTKRPVVAPARFRRVIFKGHRQAVNGVALSPDGRVAASASNDKTVILWETATGHVLHVLREHASPVRSVTWSHDGRLLASLGDRIRLWQPATGESLGALPAGDGSTAIAFSPVGEILAIGGRDGSVRLVSPRDQRTIGVLRERGRKVLCLAFSHDGCRLAVSTADGHKGLVDLYDVAGKNHLRTLPSLPYWVEALAFLPDGKTVATGGGVKPGEIIFHDVATGNFQRRLQPHRSGVRSLAVAAPGLLVTGSFDHTLGLHLLGKAEPLCTGMAHRDVVLAVAISRDARLVISGGADHNVVAWHFGATPTLAAPDTAAAPARGSHEHKIHASRFSPDGRRVVSASEDGTARVFEADSLSAGPVFKMAGDPVNIAVFSPDGTRVAIGSRALLQIFDLATGAKPLTLDGHKDWILDLAWTPDGAHLVSVSEDTTAMVWDTRTGAWLRTFNGHTARLRAVALSPDGRSVATAGDDARIHLWDLATGQHLRTLHGHTLRIKALAFGPDGRLASAGADDFIKIWDPLTGHELATLPCPAIEVWTLRFAPARFLAAGGKDGLARLFDLTTGRQVACLPCADAVQALWFSPDGSELRIADRGGADLIPNIHVVQIVLPVKN